MWLIALSDHRPRMHGLSLILANASLMDSISLYEVLRTHSLSLSLLYTRFMCCCLLYGHPWRAFIPPALEPLSLSLSGRSRQDRTNIFTVQSELQMIPYSIYYFLPTIYNVYYSLYWCSLGVRAVFLIRVSAFRQPPREFRCRSVSPSPFSLLSPPSSPLSSPSVFPLPLLFVSLPYL